jgi:hypothetical protein
MSDPDKNIMIEPNSTMTDPDKNIPLNTMTGPNKKLQ